VRGASVNEGRPNPALHRTGAAILVFRAPMSVQAAPAAWPGRSVAWGKTDQHFVRLIFGADPVALKAAHMQMVIVMKWWLGLCATALLAGLLAVPCRASEVEDYLTKEGKLKEAVTVKIGGKNFLAPPDEVWIIKPSGDWVWESTDSKGKLSAKQLAVLAQHLATQDFNSLPKTQGYQPKDADSGYHYVVIAFGDKECTFYTKSGESPSDYLPRPDDPKAAAWSRFIALELVLADMLNTSEVRAEYGTKSGRGRAK
jgi:hypothetical protein